MAAFIKCRERQGFCASAFLTYIESANNALFTCCMLTVTVSSPISSQAKLMSIDVTYTDNL